MVNDSVVIDSVQLAPWQGNPRYDYDRELTSGNQNLLEWLSETFSQWLKDAFNTAIDNDFVYFSLCVAGALLMVFLAYVVWKKNPRLFRRDAADGALDYDVTEDTIYGIDFDAAIADAIARDDYRQAVRLIYLQTLKKLSDRGQIDWQPSRTPMQYMRQLDSKPFHALSRHFIRVRYGNFAATDALAEEMRTLQAQTLGAAAPAVPYAATTGTAAPAADAANPAVPYAATEWQPQQEKGGTP